MASSGERGAAGYTTGYRTYILLLLTAVYVTNYADRSILSTLTQPIKAEFGLSDGHFARKQHEGNERVVLNRPPALRPEQIEALGMKHVDYIANFADTDGYWKQMGDLIRPQGSIALIVASSGPLEQDAIRGKSAAVCWELMFTRPRWGTPDMVEQHKLLNQVAEWIDAGRIKGTLREQLGPINARTMREAHARLESGRTIGKLVVAGW